jgi:S-DNA-T family DNA segregation ATPase FtsK/SpoIIIE
MARTSTAGSVRSRSRSAREEPAEPVGLELAGVGLCLAAFLLAGALFSLAPEGTSGAFRNVTGVVGRAVASAVTGAMGLGAWILPAFGVAWGLTCMRGGRPRHWGRKALLLPLLVALTAVEAALLFDSGILPGLERSGPGGYFGLAMGAAVFDAFGRAAALVVVVGWFSVFRWMTDIDVVHMGFEAARRAKARFGREEEGGVATIDEEAGASEDDEEWEYEEYEYEEGDEEDGEEEDEDDEAEYEYEEDEDGEEEDDDEEEDEDVAEQPDAQAARRVPAMKALALPTRARRSLPKRPTTRGEYVYPPLNLLTPGEPTDPETVREEVEANAAVLEETLASFGIDARVVSHLRGPVITFFEIKVPSGVRLSRVTALADDIAISLKAPSIRIVAPIPGRSTVGIEVPNLVRDMVRMRDLLEEESDKMERANVPIVLGSDTSGRPIVEDLASMPHLLIAGATGSGKSVCINAILLSILYSRGPDEVNMILVDPKQVELSFFENIPHLLTPVVTDMRRAAKILDWAVDRMEERYAKLLACGVRNVTGYNALSKEKRAAARERTGMSEEDLPEHLPYIVIVVDELADVMLTNGKEVEISITRLAQKSRAVGIHLVLATQRPSTNVITGLIKANMPTRISFVVSSKIDSRVVLDANGADRLLGHGDMLYMHPRTLHLRRAQGTLVTDIEARATVDFLKKHYPAQEYEDILKVAAAELGNPMDEDDLYEDAVRAVLSSKLGSASMLQRRLGIGYTRASRLIDMMCDHGIVGPHVGSKAREVYMELDEWEASILPAGIAPKPSEVFDVENRDPVDESWD